MQAVCDHTAATNTYTGIKGSMYLNDTKMASLTMEGMDLEFMEATQVLGIDMYI